MPNRTAGAERTLDRQRGNAGIGTEERPGASAPTVADPLRASSYFEDVCTFHRAFEIPIGERPRGTIAAERAELRRRLMEEEFGELLEAIDEGDPAHIGKEASDLIIAVLGTTAEHGLPFDAIWAAVHASNMAKVGPDGTVQRRADGKILKPAGWEPPDLGPVIAAAEQRRTAI